MLRIAKAEQTSGARQSPEYAADAEWADDGSWDTPTDSWSSDPWWNAESDPWSTEAMHGEAETAAGAEADADASLD